MFRPLKGTITFLSKSSDETVNSIYEMNVTGGEATKIFSTSTSILNYSWQSDGKHITYTVKEASKALQTPLNYKPDFFEEEMANQKGYMVDLTSEKKEAKLINVNGSDWVKGGVPLFKENGIYANEHYHEMIAGRLKSKVIQVAESWVAPDKMQSFEIKVIE
ncbi:MAG: hypothetical protein IPP71_02445 [Bacteroidetes bacterium]|nr:hypothetical protein [Bacteroidota bacterium]